jgi:hypothetical protein
MTQRSRGGRLRTSATATRGTGKLGQQKKPPAGRATSASGNQDFSIVAIDRFIQATRDSGYKGTSNAIAELIDNAIQAEASRIHITVSQATADQGGSIQVVVRDNGTGMDPFTLRNALRFGGSTRFNDRKGLGRYGMGLPNSSLSQARRVAVYTWRAPDDVFMAYLDLDEIASGQVTEVPRPRRADCPVEGTSGKHGTIVVWSRCDRLDNRRISTIVRKLLGELGRQFRYFLVGGVKMTINGEQVEPIDPLFLSPAATVSGGRVFGEPIEYEVRADPDSSASAVGRVRVTFSELPVDRWHNVSNEEKRRLGVMKGAGVSVVRAKREVDHGWFFLGGKRRENYDDWWRCEVQFDPVLDEAFGLTHTKQQVRPKAHLMESLSPDIEAIARVLNARARKAHVAAKVSERTTESERLATERGRLLKPLPKGSRKRDEAIVSQLTKRHPELRRLRATSGREIGPTAYTIVDAIVRDTAFFNYARQDGRLILVLNSSHPFYKQVYKRLAESDAPQDHVLRTQLELILLAAARSEATEESPSAIARLERQRQLWSDTLATFLNG